MSAKANRTAVTPPPLPPSRIDVVDAINAIIRSVSAQATDLERKWGYGRLPLIAGARLAELFDRQRTLYREAIANADLEQVRKHAEAMQRAWGALEAGAIANGYSPTPPDQWEFLLPDGRLVVLVRTIAETHQVDLHGREAQLWSLEEVASVIAHHPMLSAAKDHFPGAAVLPLSKSVPANDTLNDTLDDLPF